MQHASNTCRLVSCRYVTYIHTTPSKAWWDDTAYTECSVLSFLLLSLTIQPQITVKTHEVTSTDLCLQSYSLHSSPRPAYPCLYTHTGVCSGLSFHESSFTEYHGAAGEIQPHDVERVTSHFYRKELKTKQNASVSQRVRVSYVTEDALSKLPVWGHVLYLRWLHQAGTLKEADWGCLDIKKERDAWI